MSDLEQLRSDYDAIKQHADDVNQRYEAKRAELMERIEQIQTEWRLVNAELCGEWLEVGNQAKAKEFELRQAIIAAYNETKNKQLGFGLSVQVRTKLVYDEAKAVEWATVNAPVCVKRVIDAKAFDAICKTNRPDFVEVAETPTAVIGK